MSAGIKFYHATKVENWQAIQREGLRAGWDGLVHMTTNKDKAIQYVAMYNPHPVDVVVFVMNVRPEDVESYYDGAASGDDHFVHTGEIKPELLRFDGVFKVGRPKRPKRQNRVKSN